MFIESRGLHQLLHLIIGVSVLLIPISLYIGLRPICILATLGLLLFLLDYSLVPFQDFYDVFTPWLPVLFELNLLHGLYILTQLLHFSTFSSFLFLCLCILRSAILMYSRLLPIDDHHRLSIEQKFDRLSRFFYEQSKSLYYRLTLFFDRHDDVELDKFQLEPLGSDDCTPHEHDETIQRFQRLHPDLASPMISNIECSTSSTPPTRRHHQRILQQSDIEPLARTPITPAHTNGSKTKILHSTMNGSYTGPMTRNRIKTESNPLSISPLKGKSAAESTFIVTRMEEETVMPRFK
jgi:hypothetical protein